MGSLTCVCVEASGPSVADPVAALTALEWPERRLRWSSWNGGGGGGGGGTPATARGAAVLAAEPGEDDEAREEELLRRVRDAGFAEAEVLLESRTGLVPVRAYTAEELSFRAADAAEDPAPALDVLREAGMVVLQGALGPEQVAGLAASVAERVEWVDRQLLEVQGIARDHAAPFAFAEVASRGPFRRDLFLEEWTVPEDPPWLPLVLKALLVESQDELATSVNVVVSVPGAEDQEWHADGPHLDRAAGPWEDDGEASPYAVYVSVPLIRFDDRTGFTRFWPRSHRWLHILGVGAAAPVLGATFDAAFDAGDAVLYDYRTMHHGVANTTEGTVRPMMQFLYHQRRYAERRNFGQTSVLEAPRESSSR